MFKKTEDKERFEMGINDEDKIVTLLFHNANGKLTKTLSEEERKKLAKETRLMTLEIEKYSYRLINNCASKYVTYKFLLKCNASNLKPIHLI